MEQHERLQSGGHRYGGAVGLVVLPRDPVRDLVAPLECSTRPQSVQAGGLGVKDQLLADDDLYRIRELIAAASRGVEHGVVRGKTLDQHVADFRDSMAWPTATGTDLHGVYLAGTETVVCHTGNGPHSEANARLIAFSLNNLEMLVDELERLRRVAGHFAVAGSMSSIGGSPVTPTGEMTGVAFEQEKQS
jgi:hypothetical protein